MLDNGNCYRGRGVEVATGSFALFREFKADLLKTRKITKVDGRALYEYRLDSEEFEALEKLLRTWLECVLGPFDLGDVLKLSGFPDLFVLYAAEWWRRRYDGSGFSWEPILHDLGVDPDSWTPGERSRCVKEGLAGWDLKPRESGGHRFLGTVAVQGGLPLRPLGEARGGIGRLLYRVLQLAEGKPVSAIEVAGWVASLRHTLPKSYRQEIIYTLLSDMVMTVLKLKRDAKLSVGDDAVAILDRQIPDWKQRFPLSLDDQHARSLVEQLVKDAANIRIRKIKPSLPVERFLERNDDGFWHLASRIELPDVLEEQALARLFGMETADLPRMASLVLQAGEKKFQTPIRKLAGQNSFRLQAADWRFADEVAVEEHLLQLSAVDGRVWRAEVHKGMELDPDLPWVFSLDSPHDLLRQGGGKVAPAQVLLALPEGWRLQDREDAESSAVGELKLPHRKLLQVQGKVKLLAPGGEESVMQTGQATAAEQQLTWSGERLWFDFISPRQAYKGMPRLYRVDDEGGRWAVNGNPACSVLGAANDHQPLGPVRLGYPAHGERQIQARMVLLPADAGVEYKATDAKSGHILFSHWGLASVEVMDASDIKHECERQGDGLLLKISVREGVRAPEWLQLELLWPHTTHPVRMRLPYPADGVRVFDGAGRELRSGARISIQDLLGVRLVANLGRAAARKIALRMTSGRLERDYSLRTIPGALKLELPLMDYLTDIQQLMSMDDSPDSVVTVSLCLGSQAGFKLKIARYVAVLEREAGCVAIEAQGMANLGIENVERCKVYASRLEYPGDEPVELEPLLSEGVPTGSWRFGPEHREPGTWLIYPPPDNRVLFRPCLWPLEGEIEPDGPLIQAMSIKEQVAREDSIRQTIAMMAADYFHPSWQTVEQLASQYGHLPLATLDLWRMFSRSFEGMAALALRLSDLPEDFYLRFAREMPFAWEIVSLKAWREAIGQLKRQCLGQYGEEVGEQVFHSLLESRVQMLGAESGALHYLLGAARADFDENAQKDFIALKFAIGPTAERELFEGESSRLMLLRRNHAEDKWPAEFAHLLDQARNDPDVQPFLYTESYGFQDGVINVPLIAAAEVASNKTHEYFSDPENIHLLRTIRAFDMDWFDEAFNLTIARCLAEGVCDV